MLLARCVAGIFAVGTMLAGANVATGQDYPNKPIRMLASSPGGSVDVAARIIAQELALGLGQQVIVENRPAFSAMEASSKAPPDGYSLLVMGVPLWLTPFLQDHVPWDPLRDFSPITVLTSQITVLVVHPSLPVKSVRELMVLAKARPAKLSYASGTTGGSTHLAPELFKAMAGVDIVRINYKATAMALNDVIGGRVELMFATAGTAAQHIKSGRLRALAVTSAGRSALFPDLPTVAVSLPGYELVERLGLFAPARTPAPIIGRLNQETVRALNKTEIREKFLNTGSEVVGGPPEEFAAAIRSEMAGLGKLIRDAGIRGE